MTNEIPFGTQVVLAANDLPSINDVTYSELIEIISKVIKMGLVKTLGITPLFANFRMLVTS